jgi:hypothetical protein
MSREKELQYIPTSEVDYRGRGQEKIYQTDESLRESIRAEGILTSLLVRKTDEGFEVVDGNRRLKAAIGIGVEELPCIVIECEEKKAEALHISMNRLNTDAEIEEVLGVFQELLDEELEEEEIAELFGEETVEGLKDYITIEELKKDTGFSLEEFGDDFIPENYIEHPPYLVNINFQSKDDKWAFQKYLRMYPGETGHERAKAMMKDMGVYEMSISENEQQVNLHKWT